MSTQFFAENIHFLKKKLNFQLHCFLQWLNKRIYVRLHDNVYITSYSLAQRFQVAENIVPTGKHHILISQKPHYEFQMMNNVIYYMGFMNMTVVLSVLFSSFDLTPEHNFVITLCLEVSIFIYSFCYPVIMYHSCDRWKTEINLFLKFVKIRNPVINSKVYPIRNSYGISMSEENTMSNHFDHLRDAWETNQGKVSLL